MYTVVSSTPSLASRFNFEEFVDEGSFTGNNQQIERELVNTAHPFPDPEPDSARRL